MQFEIQQYVSNFVASQFPEFYRTEGPNFIAFVKAYYEFLEQESDPTYASNGQSTSTNIIYQGRKLLDYRDVDNTLEAFLEHFQKKYLYGIPFNVIINKRFLLKHILDVYRSKGSIQCYKLLFRLIYDEDIEVYLPGVDLLAPSDGTWKIPRYIEITNNSYAANLVGKTVVGLSSGTTATVENYIVEPINKNIIATLYLSNIGPRGSSFTKGEKVIDINDRYSASAIASAPTISGSFSDLTIINGGQGFNDGDILAVVHVDPTNNAIVSAGINGIVRVANLTTAYGSLNFSVNNPGFGINATPLCFVYPGNGNTAGNGASFQVGAISNTQTLTYNTDVIANYLTKTLDSASYSFPANSSANLTSNIGTTLAWTSDTFGSLISLKNIFTGNGYTQQANVFVESVERSLALPGTVNYSTAANTVTGSGTNFTYYFVNNSVIALQANSLSNTIEYAVIKQVVSDTSIVLFGTPTLTSNGTSAFYVAPAVLPANFTNYDSPMVSGDGSINGLNTLVGGYPSSGNTVVGKINVIDSGKGYVDGEQVELYLYSGVATPTIIAGGTKYTNGDALVFSGGGGSQANGFVTTNSTGGIVSTTVVYAGSGLQTIPTVTVQTKTGSGAKLTTSLTQYNTSSQVQARIIKGGQGLARGYWTTTKGMLNSDKYIQDSYFYQDYSYQIKAAKMLADYQNILYNTFHPSGTEMFGEFQLINTENAGARIISEQTAANYNFLRFLTVDLTNITVDAANTSAIPTKYTVDEVLLNPFTTDMSSITADTLSLTADTY